MPTTLTPLELDERDDIIELRRREWYAYCRPEVAQRASRAVMAAPWSVKHWHVLALRDDSGAVVASCNVFDLDLRLDARRLRLAGIGAVLVPPELRRRGHGTELLERVHAQLASSPYDGALLFSEIGEEFYRRLGYVTLPQARLTADVRDQVEHRLRCPPRTSSRLRAFEERDLESVRNLYNLTSALQALAMLRDDEAWELDAIRARVRHEIYGEPARAGEFLVGERDGALVSFVRTRRDPKARRLILLEYAFEAACSEDATALVGSALDELGAEAPPVLTGVAPQRLANLVPSDKLSWRWEENDILMLKSFGSFQPPVELHPDQRLIWQSDWF